MKFPMTKSTVIAFSVLLTLITFVSRTRAQPPQRYVFNTGVVKLGPTQILRITVDWRDSKTGQARFGRTLYTQGPCNSDGVCQLNGTSMYTGTTTLGQGDVASCDELTAGTYGRGIVVTTSQKTRVTAAIVNTVTGDVDVEIGPLVPLNITLVEVLISSLDSKVTISRRRAL